MRRLALHAFTWAAAVGALTACHSQAGSSNPPPLEWKVPVQIINDNVADVHIWVIVGGQSMTLGIVSGNARQLFTLPTWVTTSGTGFRILADPIGAPGAYTSPRQTPQPGQRVVIRLSAGDIGAFSTTTLENID